MSEQIFPRVRNRLQFKPLGIISGLLGGLGLVILLQQMAVLIPTRNVLIAGPLLGVVGSVALNFVFRSIGAARLNKVISKAEATVLQKESQSGGGATAAPPGWSPTHLIPAGGLDAWDTPDNSVPAAAHVDEGLEVQIQEQQGDWAKVSFSNGWSAWVDGRALEDH